MDSFQSGFDTGDPILWEKITPAKRRRDSDASEVNGTAAPTVHVFQQIEHEKKVQQKAKTPNTTVAKAAAKITAPDLTIFLAESSEHPVIRFADFFEREFSAVSVAQFSWVKLFRNCVSASKTGIPLSHVPGYVYEASINWIGQQHIEELIAFVQWSLRRIYSDLECYQIQDESSKSMVGVFVALAFVLRQRPFVLVHLMTTLRDTSDYHRPDMLNVVAWMIAQATEEDLAVGFYSWAHILLPLWSENSSNPQFRENVLEIVESVFHRPNSRILKCGTLSNGDRLIPPKALEILLRATFPPYSAITKDPLTVKRFQVKYAHLHQVAFGGNGTLEKEAREIFSFAIAAAGETDIGDLSYEAANICVWCLSQNSECYKIWDEAYLENLEASIAIMKRLSDSYHWREYRVKLAPLESLRNTIENFRQKNKDAIAIGTKVKLFEEADRYCEVILDKSSSFRCSTGVIFFVSVFILVFAVVASSIEVALKDIKDVL